MLAVSTAAVTFFSGLFVGFVAGRWWQRRNGPTYEKIAKLTAESRQGE
jgi:hypothetical protein